MEEHMDDAQMTVDAFDEVDTDTRDTNENDADHVGPGEGLGVETLIEDVSIDGMCGVY